MLLQKEIVCSNLADIYLNKIFGDLLDVTLSAFSKSVLQTLFCSSDIVHHLAIMPYILINSLVSQSAPNKSEGLLSLCLKGCFWGG